MPALATSMPVSAAIADWNSNVACSVPWLTSGWYGVYAVANSARPASDSTAAGMKCGYAPAPRNTRPSARRLAAASAASSLRTACSSMPAGSASAALARSSVGTDAKSASTLDAPIVASMAAISPSVWGVKRTAAASVPSPKFGAQLREASGPVARRRDASDVAHIAEERQRSQRPRGPRNWVPNFGDGTLGLLARDERAVLLRGHELIHFGGIAHGHAHHPAVAVRVVVDDLGVLREAAVHFGDAAGDRRVDVAYRLHGLDDAERAGLLQRRTLRRQLDEHDVAELLLGIVGDTDRRRSIGNRHPLVLFGIAQVLAHLHRMPPCSSSTAPAVAPARVSPHDSAAPIAPRGRR